MEMSFFIADASGRVTDFSRRFVDRKKLKQEDSKGKLVKDFIPEISFQDIVIQLERDRSPMEIRSKEPATLYPIFNSSGDLSNVICIAGMEKLYTGIEAGIERSRPASRLTSFMNRIRTYGKK
jgi:hypothetical protein